MGTHRHTKPKVVRPITWTEMVRIGATKHGGFRYVPWKQTHQVRVTYRACCRRRVTFLSSSPVSVGRLLAVHEIYVQVFLSKATLDPSVVNGNQNIHEFEMRNSSRLIRVVPRDFIWTQTDHPPITGSLLVDTQCASLKIAYTSSSYLGEPLSKNFE